MLRERELFSTIICVYEKDRPEWFKAAVDSMLEQTCKPDEIVLVVDGPIPDDLREIVSGYEKNELFNVVWLKENTGHGNARRRALENCHNEIVALMDADDICSRDRFEKQIEFLSSNKSADIVGGNVLEFQGDVSNITAQRKVFEKHSDIVKDLKKRCPFNQNTVMFRKAAVEAAGGYQDWFCNEDYYLWVRMYLNNAVFANLDENLVYMRTSEEQYSRRGGRKYFASEARLQKYMLDYKIIGPGTYGVNVLKRFIVQIMLPNSVRGFMIKHLARKQVN